MKIEFSFDAVVWITVVVLLAAIGGLYLLGNQVVDGAGSKIISVDPADGSSPTPGATIRIQFGQAMDRASVQSRFIMDPYVEGQFQWQENTLLFIPNRPFISDQWYSVKLMPGVETVTGERNSHAMKWSFKPRPPSVIYLPTDQIEVQQHVRIMTLGRSVSRELITTPTTILDFAPSPDGLKVSLSVLGRDGKSEIWLVDTGSASSHAVVNCETGSCSNPTWSPDGKLLAYARNDRSPNGLAGLDRIWLYDLTSLKTQPVYQDNQILGSHPVWSKNGRSLAFTDQNATGIRLLDLLNRKDFFISTGFFADSGSFSPDGTILAYTKLVSAGGSFINQIWLSHLGSTLADSPLIQDTTRFNDNYPNWSPDGQWIAFLRRRIEPSQSNQVMLFNRTSGQIIAITDEARYGDLKWNASGQYLLIQKYPENSNSGSMQIFRYDSASRQLSLVVNNAIQGNWLP